MKKSLISLTLILVLVSLSACSNKRTDAQAQNSSAAALKQGTDSGNQDELISGGPTTFAAAQSNAKSSWYGTEIYEMTDGFGNKVETRVFKDHPRISQVKVETTVKGEKTVEVFGQNGERIKLSPDMFDKVLTDTGDVIADVAGIFQTKKQIQAPELNLTAALGQNSQPTTANPETAPSSVEELSADDDEKKATLEPLQSAQNTENLQSSVQSESKVKPNDER